MLASYVLVTDRGGHLSNALALVKQLGHPPIAVVTTSGPETAALLARRFRVFTVPQMFSWVGKVRVFNPMLAAAQTLVVATLVIRLRPKRVLSLGAANSVLFCYLAKAAGAEIIHVECLNQVLSPSRTGKILYPICQKLFVQWPGLEKAFGRRAEYSGWVL